MTDLFIKLHPEKWNHSKYVTGINEKADHVAWKIYADACGFGLRIDTACIWQESMASITQRLNVTAGEYVRVTNETRKRGLYYHNDKFGVWINYNPKMMQHNQPTNQGHAAHMLKHIQSMPDCPEKDMALSQLKSICRTKIEGDDGWTKVSGKDRRTIQEWFEAAFEGVDDRPNTLLDTLLDDIEEEEETEEEKENNIPEIKGLSLYEADASLCKRLPELLPAWEKAYPNIDVVAEIVKAHTWELANPKKAKSDRPKFLNNWLNRAQKDAKEGAKHGKNQSGRGFEAADEHASQYDNL